MKSLFYLLLLLAFTNCTIDDGEPAFIPKLPPITTTGENTFGCYVDGVLVTPRDGRRSINGQRAEGMLIWTGASIDKLEYDEIRVRDWESGTRGIVRIYFEPAIYDLGEGIYSVQNSRDNTPSGKPIVILTVRIKDDWYRSLAGTGEVNLLRVDSTKRIVSGTFSCEAVSSTNPNRIKIKEGRFDIDINTLYKTLFP